MRSLAGSLDDGVLADAILFTHCLPILPTNIRKVRGHYPRAQASRVM